MSLVDFGAVRYDEVCFPEVFRMQQGQANVPARVVVLTRQKGIAEHVRRQVRNGDDWVLVASAYEAAAEVLAEPTAVLVMDLRLLGSRDEKLVQVARSCGTAMLGIGALPAGMSAAGLSGVTLVAEPDLDDEIARALREHRPADVHHAPLSEAELDEVIAAASDQPHPAPPEAPREPSRPDGHAQASPAQNARPVPPEELHRERNEAMNHPNPPHADLLDEARFIPEPPAETAGRPATAPDSLLSDEELAALLERDS